MTASDVPESTVIQDLSIPTSPTFYDVTTGEAITLLLQALSNRGAASSSSDEFLTSVNAGLTELSRLVRGNAETLHARTCNLWTEKSDRDDRDDSIDDDSANYAEATAEDSIEALVQLLSSARFVVLPTLPQVEDPQPVDAVSLISTISDELDPTLLAESTTVQDIVRDRERKGKHTPSSMFPHIFYATRGTALKRTSGLQLYAKWQAAERFIISIVLSPAVVLFKAVMDGVSRLSAAASVNLMCNRQTDTNEDQSRISSDDNSRIVRRVVPAVSSNETLVQTLSQLKPLITQEPCHALLFLLHRPLRGDGREGGRNSASSRKVQTSLVHYLLKVALQAFEMDRSLQLESADCEKGAKGVVDEPPSVQAEEIGSTSKPTAAQIFQNVPWGTMQHVLPASYVVPAARDLLRLDLFTLAWLASTLFASHRISSRSMAAASLFFAVVSYTAKIAIGWQNALNMYDRRIATQKFESLLCQGSCCIDFVVTLAVQEEFVDAACVWLASLDEVKRLGFENAAQLQREAFSSSRLTEMEIKAWSTWLKETTPSILF